MKQNDLPHIKKREDFGSLLNTLNLNGVGIEIGVETGEFSDILIKTSNLKEIYLLDAWTEFDTEDYKDLNNVGKEKQNSRYFSTLFRMKKYRDRVTVIRSLCEDAAKHMEDDFFDFVYLDANHKYDAVLRDLIDWFPKVRNGGIFAGHDYLDGHINNTEFGVKSAVDKFASRIGTEIIVTTDDQLYSSFFGDTNLRIQDIRFCSWYFRK